MMRSPAKNAFRAVQLASKPGCLAPSSTRFFSNDPWATPDNRRSNDFFGDNNRRANDFGRDQGNFGGFESRRDNAPSYRNDDRGGFRGGGNFGDRGGRDFGDRGGRDFGDNRSDRGGVPDRMGGVGDNLKKMNWQDEQLVTIQKDFYKEHPEVTSMTEADQAAAMKQLNASIAGRQPHPRPLMKWNHVVMPNGLMESVKQAGFERPSPIQSVGLPCALAGRDMVGVAQTGSGKTLAYVLPGLVHIAAQPVLRPGDGPIGLVMAPTRELAMQIQDEVRKYTSHTGIRSTAVFGGVPRYQQASDLRRGSEIVIATPGRLLDFLESGVTNLKRVTYLCLDEADRMLDMGFEPQIRKIVSQIRPDRQTLLYSATWPKEIQRLARDFCREDPIKLTIGSEELTCNPDIKQDIRVVSEYEKRDKFKEFMKEATANESTKVLVFTATKRDADSLCRELQYQQISASAIHGDKDQRQRDRTLAEFKSGRINVLVATDVAQRGLDIKNIEFVCNYDPPKNFEDYIHRIGRTGRAGAKGTAVTFFPAEASSPDMIRMARSITKSMKEIGQTPPQGLVEIGGFGGRRH